MLHRFTKRVVRARDSLFRRKRASAGSRPARANRLVLEPLEPRLVLDAGPLYITELMAVNDSTLADEDGRYSDWLEIHNPTDTAVELEGWYLRDSEFTWEFPAYSLEPGEYLVTMTFSGSIQKNLLVIRPDPLLEK